MTLFNESLGSVKTVRKLKLILSAGVVHSGTANLVIKKSWVQIRLSAWLFLPSSFSMYVSQ